MTSVPLGWGLDPYGTGPYGSPPSALGLSLQSAVAISTNEVQVTLSVEPLHQSPTATGDALNPATWTVQNLATLEFLNPMSVYPVTPLIYVVVVIQKFGPADQMHQISTVSLLDVAGNPLVPPRHADFAGVLAADAVDSEADLAKRTGALRDIANKQTPIAPIEGIGGTLQINSAGDYEPVLGVELLKKLILRRLMTTPGDFFHLPEYGVGLRLKEPLPAADLVKLKTEIERQVLKEQEIDQADASLTLEGDGTLTVKIRAHVRATGQQIDLTQAVAAGVQL